MEDIGQMIAVVNAAGSWRIPYLIFSWSLAAILLVYLGFRISRRRQADRDRQRPIVPRSLSRGFTLIEIAIVAVVIGLVLSMGLSALNPIRQQQKIAETIEKLRRIEDALKVYAIDYGCMPCPADGALASTSVNDHGRSLANGATYDDCVVTAAQTCSVTAADQVVPWINLGLAEELVTDGWGNRIAYHLSATGNPGVEDRRVGWSDETPCADAASLPSYEGGMCRASTTYPTGTFTVEEADGNDITAAGVFVLISFGPDGLGARAAITGTQRSAATGTQAGNTDGTSPFVQDDRIDVAGTSYFDDIVRWSTAPVFIQGCGSSVCGN